MMVFPKAETASQDKKNTLRDIKNENKDQQKDAMAFLTHNNLIKQPLRNKWTLWYLQRDMSKSWEENQNEITSFDTVEDFWSLYSHIKLPSEIGHGSDYSLFKKGIRPLWEDEANINGGRWVINLVRRRHDVDNIWLDVILCLIGESFQHSDQICGAVVSIRNNVDKISVWTANGQNQVTVMEIGRKLKESLRIESKKLSLQYILHKDTTMMGKQSGTIKAIYTIK